jgi:hypothetical protein
MTEENKKFIFEIFNELTEWALSSKTNSPLLSRKCEWESRSTLSIFEYGFFYSHYRSYRSYEKKEIIIKEDPDKEMIKVILNHIEVNRISIPESIKNKIISLSFLL